MKWLDNAEILYVDNHLAIAAKPCGMLTQPNQTSLCNRPETAAPQNLEAFVKLWIKQKHQKPGNVFLHAIHRLDRCVSGLVLFARTSKALSRLNELSRRQEIQRVYVAEVEGLLSKNEGQLDHFLIHGSHQAMIANKEDEKAKHARLYYKTIKHTTFSTFVEIELETGRYHQIRAQFSAIGHPIVGDRRYGSQTGDGSAIHLHGKKLAFKHPITNEIVTFEVPVPFDSIS
ncbi:MAG TPA: RluA family pseudouridine synthase [Chlamydiales bacterium]|nr:RluA family pseudouridine synthase [Chlamydiales bacterium]